MRIFLVRHTETEWNEQRRFIGRTDLGLSEKGKANARKLAERFQNIKFTRIYSSPYRRTIETVQQIAEQNGYNISPVEDLREIDFGNWEGKTIEEIKTEYPDVIENWLNDPISEVIPEGEHWQEFGLRVRSAYDDIVASCGEGDILIASHGGPLKNIIGYILDIPTFAYWRYLVSHGSISVVEYDSDNCYITLLNDNSHLIKTDVR